MISFQWHQDLLFKHWWQLNKLKYPREEGAVQTQDSPGHGTAQKEAETAWNVV